MASTFMRFRPLVDSSRVIGRRASRWPIIYRHIHYTPSCSQSDKRPTPKPVDEVRENRLQSAARNFVESVGEGVPSEEVPSERIDETVPLELPGDVQMRDAFCTFQAADLTPCTEPVVSDAGCRVVCTYSWSKLKRPTIKIPGFPRIWADKTTPRLLLPYINPSPWRAPSGPAREIRYPFQALFRAVEMMNATFDFKPVDIVVNRDSLKLLLGFCGGVPRESFSLDLSVIKNTLFIEPCRRSMSETEEHQSLQNPSDWGHAFKMQFTEAPRGLESATASCRAIQYDLGDLNCVVQFEADAYYDDPTRRKSLAKRKQKDVSIKVYKPPVLANHWETPLLSRAVKQNTVAEIVSCADGEAPKGLLPEMWFGRTQWYIQGFYKSETVKTVDIKNLGVKVVQWENKVQTELRKMVSLLSQLREAVRRSGAARCTATYDQGADPQELKVTISSQEDPLPDDLVQRFWPDGSDQSPNKKMDGAQQQQQQQQSDSSDGVTPHNESGVQAV